MKKTDRAAAVLGAVILTAVVVVGAFSASAAGGTQQDPLVTLSYLTQVVTPKLMDEVDKQVAANEQDLEDKLNAAIDEYAAQGGAGGGQGASFSPVTLGAGRSIRLDAGCEVLLRAGAVQISAGSSPALVDATTGSSLDAGGAMSANHLYVAPLEGCVLSAAGSVTLLLRGNYSVG